MKFNPRRFHPNISPIDVIKKGALGATYFRDIYSNATVDFIKILGKNLKN